MADLTKIIKIKVDGKEEFKSLGDIVNANVKSFAALEQKQKELKEAFAQAEYGTPEFNALHKALQQVNSDFKELDTSLEGVRFDEKVEGAVMFGEAAAGAFAVAGGAAAAFGEELGLSTDDIQAAQAKVEGLIAVMAGLNAITKAFGTENKLLSAIIGRKTAATVIDAEATVVSTVATTAQGTAITGTGLAARAAAVGMRILGVATTLATGPVGIILAVLLTLGLAMYALKDKIKPFFEFFIPGMKLIGASIGYVFDRLRDLGSFMSGGLIDSAAQAKTVSQAKELREKIDKELANIEVQVKFVADISRANAASLRQSGYDYAADNEEVAAAKEKYRLLSEAKAKAEYNFQTSQKKFLKENSEANQEALDKDLAIYQAAAIAKIDAQTSIGDTAAKVRRGQLARAKEDDDADLVNMKAKGASEIAILREQLADQRKLKAESQALANDKDNPDSKENAKIVREAGLEIVRIQTDINDKQAELRKKNTEDAKKRSEERVKDAREKGKAEADAYVKQIVDAHRLANEQIVVLQKELDDKQSNNEDSYERLRNQGETEVNIQKKIIADKKALQEDYIRLIGRQLKDVSDKAAEVADAQAKIQLDQSKLNNKKLGAADRARVEERIKVEKEQLVVLNQSLTETQNIYNDTVNATVNMTTEVGSAERALTGIYKAEKDKQNAIIEGAVQASVDAGNRIMDEAVRTGSNPVKARTKALKLERDALSAHTAEVAKINGVGSAQYKEHVNRIANLNAELSDSIVGMTAYIAEQVTAITQSIADGISGIMRIANMEVEAQIEQVDKQIDEMKGRLELIDQEIAVRRGNLNELIDQLKQDQGSGGSNAVLEAIQAEEKAIQKLNKEKLNQMKREKELADQKKKLEEEAAKNAKKAAQAQAAAAAIVSAAQSAVAIATLAAQVAKQDFTFGFATVAAIVALGASLIGTVASVKSAFSDGGFAKGGFTGNGEGTPDQSGFKVAGVVHENEYVVPKWMVQSARYAPMVQELEGARTRGFAEGGFTSASMMPAPVQSGPNPEIMALAAATYAIAQRPVVADAREFLSVAERANAIEAQASI